MAKRTAVIDIGSNSISLVVYEKSSRYAFHLIEKVRSRVRIGEGAYNNGGVLSELAMQKAYDTLDEFLSISDSLGCRKVLAVATSALRDAPNKKEFLKRVSKGLKLNIKVIDGTKEAYLGAVAALNLLPQLDNATTIDIGGGSTELAKIEGGKIVETISLDIGTVRLKELFYDNAKSYEEIASYVDDVLVMLPPRFSSEYIIGIGGTIRAVSEAIRKDSDYPLESLHGYSYDFEKNREFIEKVAQSEVLKLKKTSISKSRYDTIREGCAIFSATCEKLGAKDVITSKVGVREGVYLSDILRTNNHKFPHNFNISIKSLIDRFSIYDKHISYMQTTSHELYRKTHHLFDKEQQHKDTFLKASKLLLITRRLNIYSNSDMSFSFLIENLNFSLTHQEKVLIALILKFSHKKEVDTKAIKKFQTLLPETKVVEWLSFLLALSVCINKNKKAQKIEAEFSDKLLTITSTSKMFLAHECVKKLKKPEVFAIQILSDNNSNSHKHC